MSKRAKKYNRYFFASILLIVGIASANAEGFNPRQIRLNAIDASGHGYNTPPRGNVTISQQNTFFNYEVSKLVTLDVFGKFENSDGRFIYSIYMWTPTLGRLRIQNFNTGIGSTHSSGRWFIDEHVVAAVTIEPICVEVWFERDDGLDGPDNAIYGDHAVLRGETEEGACASIK